MDKTIALGRYGVSNRGAARAESHLVGLRLILSLHLDHPVVPSDHKPTYRHSIGAFADLLCLAIKTLNKLIKQKGSLTVSNHFIAVGGTGQHVALAYIDLAALSYLIQDGWHLPTFYLLDADASDDEGTSAWQKFIEMFDRMQSLEMNVEGFHYLAPFDDTLTGNTFNETIVEPQRQWLFDEEQRKVRYRNGYYGQAAVGATVFNHTYSKWSTEKGTPFYRIRDQIKNPGSRFLISGSSVGGTGAGCLPRLVESLASRRDPSSLLAACLFLPWFRLGGDTVQGHVEDADRRNSEMKTRASSAFLYFRDQLQKLAMTLVLGHPNIERAGSRPWQSDTRQSYHHILTVPYYGAIAASNLFSQNSSMETGLFTMVCPQLQDGDLILPDSAWTFNGVAVAKDEVRPAFRFANLINWNVSLCYRLAVFMTYTRWPKSVRWSLFPGRLVIAALDRMQLSTARVQKVFELKMMALKRLHDFQPSIFQNQEQIKQLLDFEPKSGTLRNLGGVDYVRDWLQVSVEGQEGGVPRAWILKSLSNHLDGDRTSAERCMPALPQDVAGYNESAIGTIENITNQLPSETLIRLDHIDARAVPSTASIRFLLESFLRRFSEDPNAAAPFDKGKVLAERVLMLLKGVAAGRIIIHRYLPDIGQGQISLTDCYNETIPNEANRLERQVGLYLDSQDFPGLLAVSDPETLLCPSAGVDWPKVEDHLQDTDRRIQEGRKTLKGWLLFLSDMHDTLHGSSDKPYWFQYLLNHPDLSSERVYDPSFEFDLLDDNEAQLFNIRWSNGSASLPLALPVVGRRNRQKMKQQILRFGFQTVKDISLGDSSTQDTPTEVIKIVDFLRDSKKCPPFIFFSKNGNEKRIAVWADLYKNLVARFRFGFCFADTKKGTPESTVAWCIHTPDEFDIIPATTAVLLNAVAPLAGRVTLQQGEEPIYPDYPVKAAYADLINYEARHSKNISGPAATISYMFKLKGRPDEERWPVRIEQRPQPCTIAFWPKFELDGWNAYYAFANFSATDSILAVFMTGSNSQGLSRRLLHHHYSGQPLFDLSETELSFQRGGRPTFFTVLLRDDTDRSRGVGLFRVALMKDVSRLIGPEQWGVDFGTYSTVVAAKAGPKSVNITTAAKLDQTLVVTKDERTTMDSWTWFPTFNTNPNVAGSALVPSLMTSLNPTVVSLAGKLGGMRYKKDFTINALEKSVINEDVWGGRRGSTSFKWFDTTQGGLSEDHQLQLRRSYLLHLIEICLALRVGMEQDDLQHGLPERIRVTFGLPLRMWDQFPKFKDDVDRITATLTAMTGIQFDNHFQWESLAGKLTSGANSGNVYVVADLGGGSIDLWGGFYPGFGRHQWAESFRFGGDDLLRQLDRDFGHKAEHSLLYRIRYEPQETMRYIITGKDKSYPTIQGAYDLAREIISRWAAAIAVKCHRRDLSPAAVGSFAVEGELIESGKDGIDSVYPVKIDLLGMGWMLNETTKDSIEPYVATINDRANQLLREGKQSVRVMIESREKGARISEDSKTELARRLADQMGEADLVSYRKKPKTFNLVDIVDYHDNGEETYRGQRCSVYRWKKKLPFRIESKTAKSLEFLLDQGQPTPRLCRHLFDDRDQFDLVSELRELPDAVLMSLQLSPFRILVEYLRHRPRANRI